MTTDEEYVILTICHRWVVQVKEFVNRTDYR